MDIVDNVLYLADSYKITHHNQYPPNTSLVYSYFESRGGKFPTSCFFGLQYIIKRWLVGPVVNQEMVQEAKKFYGDHFGQNVFNENGWMHIVKEHGGHLPLRIKAVPEGTVVPVQNVLFTIENTDPAVPWLTNWFETVLVQTWYPMTVCTNSRAQKEVIARYLLETADDLSGLPFKLHDFGYRGCTSVETAGIGDAAHLVNFCGTDTIAGLQMCRKYYHCQMAGFSIPASEHSTITTWKPEGEREAFRNMLEQYPTGLVSVVSDSFDIYNAVTKIWGEDLKHMVEQRGSNGCLVIRPDSGQPVHTVLKVLTLLAEKFPVSLNKKGYRVLPPYLRLIQGDGICYESICDILEAMKKEKWSADNVVFGSGGALLQKINRDTLKCAFKCSYVIVGGEQRQVYKDPVTDPGKRSKPGRLTLEMNSNGEYVTTTRGTGNPDKDVLVTVFENGKLLRDYTMKEIRQRAELDCVSSYKREQSYLQEDAINGLSTDAEYQ